ncbi:EAL domain-containing protein [Aquisalimonas sp. 2447]|uniref:EAL domain-containing protein n=1 Tax=Aquisalimonas sp. 2447 TaxID=2740807 RepID=UPI0014327745|nr:EAL domain-containing protein [Aquisalimonas sp. 2447]QIT55565.1 EAL domain-containing protein [Aquisalimonas sp. 2447]
MTNTVGNPVPMAAEGSECDSSDAGDESALRLIAELSSRFISVSPGEVEGAIRQALADIAALARVDRAYVIQSGEEGAYYCTHEWCAEGVPSRRDKLRPVPARRLSWIRGELDAGRVVNVADTRTMAPAASGEKELYREYQVAAVLIAPLFLDGQRIGSVGFDMIHAPRRWGTDLELLLTLTGQMMLGVLQRQQKDESLLASQQRYRDLVENSVESIIVLDADRNRIIDINDNTTRLFGADRDTLMNAAPEWVLPPEQADGSDSLEQARDIIRRCLSGERLVFDWVYRNARGESIPCEVRAVPLPASEGRRIRLAILDVSERKRVEQEQLDYLRRTREQHFHLGRVATSRALAEGDLEALYQDVCDAVCTVLGVHRASLWMLDDKRTILQCEAGSERGGARRAVVAAADPSGELDLVRNAAYLDELRNARALAIEDVEQDSRASGMLDSYLRPRGIRGLLDASVRVSGEVAGVICAEAIGASRQWRVDEINFVSAMADQVAQALINHDRAAALDALRESEQRYRALYDDNPSMFFTIDESGFVASVNRFAAESLGYRVEELVGLPFDVLHHQERRGEVDHHLHACHRAPGEVHRWDSHLEVRGGGTISVRVSARTQPQADDRVPVLAVCEDTSEARELAEELSYQARHDALTGLYNRREYETNLKAVLDDARDEGSEHVICYLDLDQFKVINDTCGHLAGDELLRQLSAVLQEQLGDRDMLARLGGDEFGILLRHRSAEAAYTIADGVRQAVSEFQFTWDGRAFGLGVSIGLVPIAQTAGTMHDVMSVADTACYAAKDQGRNRIHVYRQGDEELERRHGEMQWVSGIREALTADRLRLYCQPIVPLQKAEQRRHYELLLRMEGTDGQLIQPGAFLPAAERFNLIPTVDRWVIDNALNWLEGRPGHLEQLGSCAINLSGLSVGDEDFLDWLLARMRSARVEPHRICFEITETAAIRNLSVATEFMTSLRGLGCRFALDDFGSGLSSFAYLKNLPVDAVKIDGMFVRDLDTNAINHAVVRSINDIGHVMGKSTVAEFVETESVRRALTEIGVDYAQGFGIARPMPLDAMDAAGN